MVLLNRNTEGQGLVVVLLDDRVVVQMGYFQILVGFRRNIVVLVVEIDKAGKGWGLV